MWFLPGLYVGLYLYMVGVGGALFSRLHSAGRGKKNTESDQCFGVFFARSLDKDRGAELYPPCFLW